MVLTSEEKIISKTVKKISQTKVIGIFKKVKTDSDSIKKEIEIINKTITKISSCDKKNQTELLNELDRLVKQNEEVKRDIENILLDLKLKFLECSTKISEIPEIPESLNLSPQLIFSEFQESGVSISLNNYISNKKNTKSIIQNFCKTNNIQVKVAPLKRDELYDAIITQLIDIYSI